MSGWFFLFPCITTLTILLYRLGLKKLRLKGQTETNKLMPVDLSNHALAFLIDCLWPKVVLNLHPKEAINMIGILSSKQILLPSVVWAKIKLKNSGKHFFIYCHI